MVEFVPNFLVSFLQNFIKFEEYLLKKQIHHPVAWESSKRVVLNKSMYTGKKCQKLKHVYTFIQYTRVIRSFKIYVLAGQRSVKR